MPHRSVTAEVAVRRNACARCVVEATGPPDRTEQQGLGRAFVDSPQSGFSACDVLVRY
jgi:hypothetical protein